MCGIAGKLSCSNVVDPATVEQMCAVLEHRGPDSRGLFLDDGVGIGIQRLRVIDLETGDQPIYNEDESLVLVLNGEIYNYKELRSELVGRGHRFATRGDAEVIVHLYEDCGLDCVKHLRGMFAFALWDRTRRRLVLARDRVGKKPLLYAHQNGDFWFGSETKAILQDEEVPRDVDFDAIDCFLHFQYVPHPLSAFAALRKLPPAHLLVWKGGEIRIERYWRLAYVGPPPTTNDAEIHELIRQELLEATRLRMRSDVPIGAFLSGGVDSSAVVAAMAKQASGRVKTFSIGFDVDSYDESRYAREVAQMFDTDHHELRVRPDALEILPRLVWHYGEPFADHSAIPSFYLAEMTRKHVTVALNGDGGDESFAGYRRYVGNRAAEALAGLPKPVRLALAALSAGLGPGSRVSGARARFGRLAQTALMEPYERYAMWVAYFNEQERRDLYAPEFLETLAPRTAPSVIRDPYMRSDASDIVNRLLDVDVQTYLPGDLLVKMDIASMAHSLEVRSPLLDHRLMELAASLPGSTKVAGRTTKKIFKDALRPWLPSHILERPKWGFGVPIGAWFRAELRELPREILLDRRSLQRGFFRPQAVSALIDDHVRGRRDNTDKIWALIQLELWLRMYVDQSVARPVAIGSAA
jgi:asparagine synthase (glutamine-hydrolysing)